MKRLLPRVERGAYLGDRVYELPREATLAARVPGVGGIKPGS